MKGVLQVVTFEDRVEAYFEGKLLLRWRNLAVGLATLREFALKGWIIEQVKG
jgi:hypothetical protein